MPLSKIKILFIRACKSRNPRKRLESVHRRFYGKIRDEEERKKYITILLADICDEFCPIKTVSLLNNFSPSGYESSFNEKCFFIVYQHIRQAHPDNFPGYIAPAIFRK